MPQSPREHPKPWTIQETSTAFRVVDADSRLLAEIPFGTGLGFGLSREAARQMADRMLAAGEALAPNSGQPRDGQAG